MDSTCSRLFPKFIFDNCMKDILSLFVPGWNWFFDSFFTVVILQCWQISQRVTEVSKFCWVWAVWHVLSWGGHVVRMRGRGHVTHTCLECWEPECRRWQRPTWLVNIHWGWSRELNWFRTGWGIICGLVTGRSITRGTSGWQWRAGATRVWSVGGHCSFTQLKYFHGLILTKYTTGCPKKNGAMFELFSTTVIFKNAQDFSHQCEK